MNSHAQLSAAQQLASSAATNPAVEAAATVGTPGEEDVIPELKEVEDDGPVDETGVDAKDIDLVMQQVNCSRAKAVRALRDSGGDLINASKTSIILDLSSRVDAPCSHGCKRVDSCIITSPFTCTLSMHLVFDWTV
jgi:NACalpha-BTF3-like transcription factor